MNGETAGKGQDVILPFPIHPPVIRTSSLLPIFPPFPLLPIRPAPPVQARPETGSATGEPPCGDGADLAPR